MDLFGRIKRILLLYLGLCVIAISIVYFYSNNKGVVFWLSAILITFFVVLYIYIYKPIRNSQTLLDKIIEDKSWGEILKYNDINKCYMNKIQLIIEKLISQITRTNSEVMFDKQAELSVLQSQINPHFLYNTLESIRGQALIDNNREIAKMVEALASFFRYSISRKGNLVTLRDELKNIDNYMLIQRYRFNNRFSLEVHIDEEDEVAYDYLIPKLTIQPIVENAIFHGLEEILKEGIVSVEVIITEDKLILTISDNGKGMDNVSLLKLNARIQDDEELLDNANRSNSGIALKNINKRIKLLFGNEYGLKIYSTLQYGTDVEITLPINC